MNSRATIKNLTLGIDNFSNISNRKTKQKKIRKQINEKEKSQQRQKQNTNNLIAI